MQNKTTSKWLHIDSLDRLYKCGAERSWDMGWHGLLLWGPPGEFCRSPEQPMVTLSCRRSCCPLRQKLWVLKRFSNYFSLMHNTEGWENEPHLCKVSISGSQSCLSPRLMEMPSPLLKHNCISDELLPSISSDMRKFYGSKYTYLWLLMDFPMSLFTT